MDSGPPELGTRQLRAVTTLAQFGSFVAAASHLDISQPALTRTIKQVEAALGVDLFARTTRHVALTAAGREFVPVAERLLGDLTLGIRNMQDLAGRQRGQLIVASLMSVAYSVLPPVIAAYRTRYPAIQIQLRENVQALVHEDVRTGIADFGIGDVDTLHGAVAGELLRSETFTVVMPRNHRLSGRKSIAMAQLRGETVISLTPEAGIRRIIDTAAVAAEVSTAYDITVNQFATLYRFIREGLGVAIVPAGAAPAADDPALGAAPLAEPGITRRVGLLTSRDRALSPAAQGFLDLLRPAFAGK
ncbi:MAG: LysR substrate-binding domain-containing protein [Alphaproteobacteria bacterium]